MSAADPAVLECAVSSQHDHVVKHVENAFRRLGLLGYGDIFKNCLFMLNSCHHVDTLPQFANGSVKLNQKYEIIHPRPLFNFTILNPVCMVFIQETLFHSNGAWWRKKTIVKVSLSFSSIRLISEDNLAKILAVLNTRMNRTIRLFGHSFP